MQVRARMHILCQILEIKEFASCLASIVRRLEEAFLVMNVKQALFSVQICDVSVVSPDPDDMRKAVDCCWFELSWVLFNFVGISLISKRRRVRH